MELMRTCHSMHPWTGLTTGLVSGIASPSPPAGKGILRTLRSYVLMAGDANIHPVHALGTGMTDHLKPCKGPEEKRVTSTLHEGGRDSCRKALRHYDISENELRH